MGARDATTRRATLAVPEPAATASLLLVWAAGALVFFRRPIFTGFRSITGDNGDTRLIVYLHEHWMLVFRGLASWRDPTFFFPTADSLGYSDTFILDELFYAPLRSVGLDTYAAFQLTLILLTLVGFLGSYFLLRRILPEHRPICAVLAMTFAFSNMMYVQAGHSQLYAVHWLPTVVMLILRSRTDTRSGLMSAFLAGVLLGIGFLSTFYVAWFFALGSVWWSAAFYLLGRDRRITWRAGSRQFVAGYWKRAAGFATGTAVGGIPFLLVYLPVLASGGRPLGIALDYAAEPRDIINTGARNWLWGPLTRRAFGHSPRITNGELGFGLTPVLLAALTVATVHLLRRRLLQRRQDGDGPGNGAPALASALTAWFAIIAPMKFSGVSLWIVIWLVVPGARAIRAIDRIGVIAGLLAPIVVAFAIADILRRRQIRPRTPGGLRRAVLGSMAVVVLVAVEQFNIGKNAGLDRPAELAAVAAVPLPPPACHVLYLTIPADHPPPAYVSSIDAMLIAQSLTSRGTPMATINGFSGQFPAGYGSVADPASTTYAADVRAWITAHGLAADTCSYDPGALRWAGPPGR